jgi:CheY-like chemotaxis protein
VLQPEIRSALRQLEEATHMEGGLLLVRDAGRPWPMIWAGGNGLLFGAGGPTLSREPMLWWRAVASSDVEALRAALAADRDDQVIEYRVRTVHAGTRWVRESLRRVEVAAGGSCLVSAVRDVTGELEAGRPRAAITGAGGLQPGASDGDGDLVLLVEDDDAVRSVLARVLAREGYPTLLAASTAEALRLFERAPRPPVILITDVILPDRPGPELARALQRRRPDLPVLFISGYGAEELRRGGELPEGSTLLPKPFTPLDLVTAIRATLAASARTLSRAQAQAQSQAQSPAIGGGGLMSGPQSAAS